MRLLRLLPFTLAFGCVTVTTVQRDGFVLGEESWKRDESAIRSQASFMMQCPGEQLSLRVLTSSSSDPTSAGAARGVGVTGCGKQTSWVKIGRGTWAANSES